MLVPRTSDGLCSPLLVTLHSGRTSQTRLLALLLTSVQGKIEMGSYGHPLRLTFEALDWLKRSFCSKILEYFFRSFLIC